MDHKCLPTHEGPFFVERAGVSRCDACGVRVSEDQIRSAARAVQRDLDGNDLQRAESVKRLEGRNV